MLLICIFVLIFFCYSGSLAAEILGGKMEVNWPEFISTQDVVQTKPVTNVRHGILLGDGDIGVSIYGPPECITIQIGKNDIWDYRDPSDDLPPAPKQECLLATYHPEMLRGKNVDCASAGDVWGQYAAAYEVPMHTIKPAGQIRLRNKSQAGAGFNNRLRLWDAESVVTMDGTGSGSLRTFVSYPRNLIVMNYRPSGMQEFDLEFERHKDTSGTMPNVPEMGVDGRDMWIRYRFPGDKTTYPDGFEYVMYCRVIGGDVRVESKSGKFLVEGNAGISCDTGILNIEAETVLGIAHVKSSEPVTLLTSIFTTRDDVDPFARAKREVEEADKTGLKQLAIEHRDAWHEFWRRSLIQLEGNDYLTRHWYVSNYHLACCSRPGKVAPGLYGNWTWADSTPWWSDYHWDYNFQQTFWAAYSSNHLEQAVPYNQAVYDLLPAAKQEAKHTYGIDGAKYFIISYPRKTNRSPYACPPWDRIMSISAWVAQEMWWYYQYSQDIDFLRKQAYPVMKECSAFYEGFLTLADDGKYDICPTVSPEHWGVTPKFERNKNCAFDIAIIKYMMKSCISASEKLGVDEPKRSTWRNIDENMRDYPTGDTPVGKVIVDVEGAPFMKETGYNCPVPVMPVFPGNGIGLHTPEPLRGIATRTAKYIDQHLINQYIMTSMARLRLGLDVMDEFEANTRQIRMPNGALPVQGYPRIWVEQFAAPLIINESILQSYAGYIHLAPVKMEYDVRFARLRTEGAFLVSGKIRKGGEVVYVSLESEAGCECHLLRPWDSGSLRVREAATLTPTAYSEQENIVSFKTEPGCTYIVDRAESPWENMEVERIRPVTGGRSTPAR